MDVVLYRMLGLVRTPVEIDVAGQIVGHLHAQANLPRWSVLSHSLGTAVTHGALYRAYTADQPLRPQATRPNLVMMVANVSRVLQTDPDVYESPVKPGLRAGERWCRRYYTVRNRFDPFTYPRQFNPPGEWPDSQTVNRRYFRSIVVDHVREPNVHGFEHYLRNPVVHIPLFKALSGEALIPPNEEQDAAEKFYSKSITPVLEQHRDKLLGVLPDESSTWEALIDGGLELSKLLVGKVA